MVAIVLFGTLVIALILNMPVGIAIGLSSLCAVLADGRLSSLYIVQQLVTSADSFPLMAIPLFILAGELMGAGGVSKRLLNVCNVFLGRFTGGLATVTVVLCMFFAAVSGSGPATVAAIGSMVIPTMLQKGYSKSFTLALIATAGSIGVIIPPSIPFVIYAVVVGESISDLFMAGIVPGILMGVVLIIVSVFRTGGENVSKGERPTFKKVWVSFKGAFWALLTPVIILGGIYSGIFTPTESAVVAVVYCFVVSVFIYREIDLKGVYDSFYRSISVNGMTTFMVGLSMAFAAYLTMERIPHKIAAAMLSVTDNRIVLLLLINVFLLFIGCLIDNIPATIILSPILLPVVTQIGMSPITFGVMLTMNLAIGFVTPPYGINLFVAAGISGEPMTRLIKPMLFFIGGLLIALGLTTFCEPVTLGLLGLMK